MTLSMLLISLFTFVELNCENLFDCRHDSLKNDTEFLPDGAYHWTRTRYWQKLDRIGQTILSCGEQQVTNRLSEGGVNNGKSWQLPDMVALCEVENDSVLHDLTRRSLLRNACYEYVMTNSPDERGIDVALMYSPYSFRLIGSHSVRVNPIKGNAPHSRHSVCFGCDSFGRRSACHSGAFAEPSWWREVFTPVPYGCCQTGGGSGRLNI